jgi:hypothetical protein
MLKSVIHTSEPYVKIGKMVLSYNLSHVFGEKLSQCGSFDLRE